MSDFLFWDPFAAFGMYDPVVYTNQEMVKTPNGPLPPIALLF